MKLYHNLQIHKNRVSRRESENNLGYGFLISPHKDVYLIEEYQLTTNEEVIQGIDSLLWQSSMMSEMDSMYTNYVWILVIVPQDIVPIDTI